MRNPSFMTKRWTIRGDAKTSIISNYSVLHELRDWSLDTSTLIEMKARIRGVPGTHAAIRVLFWLDVGSQSAPAY